tara:strand:+ start:813 stop:1604 length:792 start_codon:yes stop_codon:yes gene_type:complete
MAILGKIDAATFANTVGVTAADATVTKNAADSVDVGDILVLDGVSYLVKEVTSTTAIELHKVYAGSTDNALAGAVRRTAPKAVADYVVKGGDSSPGELIFADTTEAALAVNKNRGIWGPGWWLYKTYDVGGDTRHKAECLAHLNVAVGTSGDFTDDTTAADALAVITIGTQPAAASVAAGNTAQFTVAATVTTGSGTLAYQWQVSTNSGVDFADVTTGANGTTAIYTTAATAAGDNGNQYRCKVTTDTGAAEVVSSAAALTVT